MVNCPKCQSKSVRSRTNYSHGTKSRSITTVRCNNCHYVIPAPLVKKRR